MIARICNALDRWIGLNDLKQAVRDQNAFIGIAERDEARDALRDKTAQATESAQKLAAAESLVNDRGRDVASLRDRLDAYEQRLAKRDAELADARHVIDQCEADRNTIAEERNRSSDCVARLAAERDELRTRIADTAALLTGPKVYSVPASTPAAANPFTDMM